MFWSRDTSVPRVDSINDPVFSPALPPSVPAPVVHSVQGRPGRRVGRCCLAELSGAACVFWRAYEHGWRKQAQPAVAACRLRPQHWLCSPSCMWKLQGPSPHHSLQSRWPLVLGSPGISQNDVNLGTGVLEARLLFQSGLLGPWTRRFYHVAGMLQAALRRVTCKLNFLGCHLFSKFSFIQLQCKTVRLRGKNMSVMNLKDKIKLENVKCRFCKNKI